MKRWIIRGLKWLAWGLAALVMVVLASNAFDASLSDDAQALARVPANPYPPEQNLFDALKGFSAPEAKLVAQLELNCNPLTGLCWTEVEKHAGDIRRAVDANAEFYRRYLELPRWTGYFETTEASLHSAGPTFPPHALRNLFLAHTALQLKIGTPQQRRAALAALEADIQVWRRMLLGEGGLVSKMVALANLHADLLLVGDMVSGGQVDVSAHAAQIDTLLSAMQPQDWHVRGIGNQEFRFFRSVLPQLRSGTSAWPRDESVGAIEAWFSDSTSRAGGYFLLLNDTLNRSAELWVRMGRVERADGAAYLAERTAFDAWAREQAAETLPIRNPIGRTLVYIAPPNYVGYLDRGRDKEAAHRLVRLAFEMRKAGIEAQAVPAFMARHPEWATHPVTGKPFAWDAQAQRLSVPTLTQEQRRYELRWVATGRAS